MVVIKNNLKEKYTPGGKGGGGVWVPGGDAAELLASLMGMLGGGGKGGKKGKGGGSWQQQTFKVDKSGGELGEQIGTIKSFAFGTNYGFIECPEVTAAGYGDVFLHGDMKKGYQQGQTVKFDCVLNKDGKPVAINLRSGLKDSSSSGQQQFVKNDWQKKTFEVDNSGGELGEQIGTIKSFSEKNNYGFIECSEVTEAGYGDVFLHGDMKKGYQQGHKVKFDCILNAKGKPVAINLKSGVK
jgi:cold shock CspA family protein